MAAAIEQKALASDTVSRAHADYTQTPTGQRLRWESVELAYPELLPEFKLAVAALFQ